MFGFEKLFGNFKEETQKTEDEGVFISPEKINGIKFYCEWNDNYGGYVILFPQIAEIKGSEGIHYSEEDWIIEMTKNPTEVKEIFEDVKKIASGLKNVNDLFSSVKAYLSQRSK